MIVLTDKDEKYCEYWLCFWSALSSRLTQSQFTEERISKLIAYEMLTRRRRHVLHRLAGRNSRLQRIKTWKGIERYLDHANQRKSDRGVSEEKG